MVANDEWIKGTGAHTYKLLHMTWRDSGKTQGWTWRCLAFLCPPAGALGMTVSGDRGGKLRAESLRVESQRVETLRAERPREERLETESREAESRETESRET